MLPFLFAVLVLVSCETEQVDDLKASPSPGTTLSKYNQFISSLTSEISGRRYVHSSGGAAGGIISEGQGYGLLAAATTAAIIGPTDPSFSTVVNQAYSLFLGWKQMCIQSTSDQCQSPRYCTNGGSTYPCLPHWKFDDSMGSAIGTGSAPDGDEDAILGMIVLLKLTQTNKPTWWNDLAQWTFNSCKQFYDSSTVQGNTASDRIVKLGACWGGWDCQNPSYHAPYAYKAMRDWMTSYSGTSDSRYNWNALISTTYRVLLANQCSQTGLVTNWYVPNKNDPSIVGTTSCSGSGTPAAEYGSEASRTIWRVAIDWIFTRDPNARTFLSRLVPTAEQGWRMKSDLPKGCLVSSIHPGWTTSAFLYGPTLTSLILRDSTISTQQTSLNSACSSLYQQKMDAYYDGSWAMLSFMTLNGDLAKITPMLTGSAQVPVPPLAPRPAPVPVAPAPVAPVPMTDLYRSGLKNSWENWSWSTNANINDATRSTTVGGRSISWTPTNNDAIYLHHPSGVKCGTTLQFQVFATSAPAYFRLNINPDGGGVRDILQTISTANTWIKFSINLKNIGFTGTTVNAVQFQERNGQTASYRLYIDAIAVGTPSTTPSPVPVAPRPVPVTPTSPRPVPVPAPTPRPVPAPVTSGTCSYVKYGGNPDDPYFIPLYVTNSASTVSIKCPNGASYPCKYDAGWQRWTCTVTTSCPPPRQAIVNGITCQLDVKSVQYRLEDEGGSPMPVYGIVLIAVGVVVVVVALGAAVFLLMRRQHGEERV